MEHLLGAEELLERTFKEQTLPSTGCMKAFAPDGTEEDDNALQLIRKQYDDLLQEERICRRCILVQARWDSEKKMAIVETLKGNVFKKFGMQNADGEMSFNAEETIFLVDQGTLELTYDKLPLSVQEVFMLILPLLPSFEYYQVFSYLCRLGFMVRRYQKKSDNMKNIWRKPISSLTVDPLQSVEATEPTSAESMNQLKQGYMKCLWTGDGCQPLIQPCDAKTTSAVLSKLQVIEQVKLRDTNCASSIQIHFDVFTVDKNHKKTKIVSPSFRIIVCKYSNHPSVSEMSAISNESGDVNIKLAVVKEGTVSFYSVFECDLPKLISIG